MCSTADKKSLPHYSDRVPVAKRREIQYYHPTAYSSNRNFTIHGSGDPIPVALHYGGSWADINSFDRHPTPKPFNRMHSLVTLKKESPHPITPEYGKLDRIPERLAEWMQHEKMEYHYDQLEHKARQDGFSNYPWGGGVILHS